ncbi:MAG: ATP-binding protein [Chloroflexota bacterium]|nr:ATP-binding protein [Chloroflexota bacterium]
MISMNKQRGDVIVFNNNKLMAVFNSINESIVTISTDGNITLVNQYAQTLTGLSDTQLLGAHLLDLPDNVLTILGYRRDELKTMLDELSQRVMSLKPKETYRIPDVIPPRVLERAMQPVRNPEGELLGWLMVWRDVTTEHEANQQREAIIDVIIHNLRSPVSAVLGAIDLLDEVIPEEIHADVIDNSLRVARRGAKRVLLLTKSLLDIVRMQSGHIELERSPVDLSIMAYKLVEDAAYMADEYGIDVHNEVPDDLPIILVDEKKIRRMIAHLLDNAVKFSIDNSQVRIRATPKLDKIIIQVYDTGPGIPAEHREMIFERYAQIEGQLGRWRGAGMGLAFCRLVVDAHGGKIWVEDLPKNRGSVFNVSLPI